MAQIKKKFIQDGAVDGEKLLLLNNQAVKAKDSSGQDQELFKLDTAGVLKLLKLPVLPSETPAGDYQVASKKFVDDSVAGEASLRESAISAEAAARTKADNALSDRLDILEADETTKAYVDSQISAEASERAKEDGLLQGQIDTEKGRIDAILLASDADKDSFAEIVQLINSIDSSNDKSFAAYVLSNDAALAQEVSDRQDADSALSGRLDVLEADPVTKKYVDAADTALDGRLDVLEADPTTKAYVDGIESALDGRLDVLESDPTTKTYVDGEISGEAAARLKADQDLSGRLDVLEADPTTKAYVDGEISGEAASRLKADNALDARLLVLESDPTTKAYVDAAIATEQQTRDDEIVAVEGRLEILEGDNNVSGSVASIVYNESVERSQADYNLQNQITANRTEALQHADELVLNEFNRAFEAETGIRDRLDIIEGMDTLEGSVAKAKKDAKDYADGIVASEAATRSKADTDLQGQLDTEKGRIDAILLASDADKDSFAEIVALINSVDTTNDKAFAAYVLSNDAALAQEVQDRQDGDTALSNRIDALELDPVSQAAVTAAINAEAAERSKADSELSGRLDLLEADPTTKAYVDGLVSGEATARENADNALSVRLDVIEGTGEGSIFAAANNAAVLANGYTDSQIASLTSYVQTSFKKETFTLSSQDISNGYVEIDTKVAASDSTVVYVGRLAAIEGVDYTMSIVSGSTRITWSGELASGGASALIAGDVVHVKYFMIAG